MTYTLYIGGVLDAFAVVYDDAELAKAHAARWANVAIWDAAPQTVDLRDAEGGVVYRAVTKGRTAGHEFGMEHSEDRNGALLN
jgi:hypothetical protein